MNNIRLNHFMIQGCQPYSIVPCPRNNNYCLENNEATPQCFKNYCTNENYDTSLKSDLYFGISLYIFEFLLLSVNEHFINLFLFFLYNIASKVYSVRPKPEIIMNEILTNGPVVSAMRVFDDFLHYKSGQYTLILPSSYPFIIHKIG